MRELAPSPSTQAREDAALFKRHRSQRTVPGRDALVARFLPLAQHLARRYPGGADREDIDQVAAIGLLKAIDRYDPDRGIAFSSFAVPTILGEIRRYFRDLGWTVRVPRDVQELALRLDRHSASLEGELGREPTLEELAQRSGATVEQVLEARASATAHHTISLDQPAAGEDPDDIVSLLAADEPGFARIDEQLEVDNLLSVLPERERRILLLRFREELKQREIAERVGCSQMQVSRLLAQSLSTLRSHTVAAAPLAGAASVGRPVPWLHDKNANSPAAGGASLPSASLSS